MPGNSSNTASTTLPNGNACNPNTSNSIGGNNNCNMGSNLNIPTTNVQYTNANPLTPSLFGNTTSASSNQPQNQLNEDRSMTYTNYYKFCCLVNVNCYFYQFNQNQSSENSNVGNNSNGNSASTPASNSGSSSNAVGTTYKVLQYEQLIKNKLKNDYQINDVITWIAKKELCVFQLQMENPNETFDSNVSFNQLKDAMSNIICENNLSLKLISASTFDASKIFKHNSSESHSTQNQLQKKSLNVIYLSFLRAVHKFILQKMANFHSLFDASNQSLSIEIFPYSGQLITSSIIQKSIVTTTQDNVDFPPAPKKKKVLKKLVPYSILKINPSLNQKNELIVNMTNLKKIFYKFTDYITVSCGNSIETLDTKSNFALYIAPSGIRCLIAGNSFKDSITDIPPENHEKLFEILKTFNDIDIISNPTFINEKRLWIKIHPSGFSSNNTGPVISKYLDPTLSTGKKFIYWPVELCFIQFPSDYTPGVQPDESLSEDNENFSIEDPFQMIDEFMEIVDDLDKSKLKEETLKKQEKIKIKLEKDIDEDSPSKNSSEPQSDIIDVNIPEKSDFRFPDSFVFNPEIDSIDQQLKPLKEMNSLQDIIESNNDFDDLFDQKNTEISSVNIPKGVVDNDFEQQLNEAFQNNDNNHRNVANDPEDLINVDKNVESNFEEDWDDLFGDSDPNEEENTKDHNDIVDSMIPNSNANDASFINENENLDRPVSNEGSYDYDKVMDDAIDAAMDNLESNEESVVDFKPSALTKLDISLEAEPRSEPIESTSIINTSPFYQDPGAPSPIPFQIFAPADPPEDENSFMSNENKVNQKLQYSALTPKERRKSIFSPLNFNPLIEKDIDSKYSNGGKFFVKNHNSSLENTDIKNPESVTVDKKQNTTSSNINTPSLDNTFYNKTSLTTPSFLVRGPGKSSSAPIEAPNDTSSESDDDDDLIETDNIGLSNYEITKGDLGINLEDQSEDIDNSDINAQNTFLYDLIGAAKGESGDLEYQAEVIDGDDNENTDVFGSIVENDFKTTENKLSHLTELAPSSGLGIIVSAAYDGNSAKRRKLETIFDTIDDDDELDLDFEDDEIENSNAENVPDENKDDENKSEHNYKSDMNKNSNDEIDESEVENINMIKNKQLDSLDRSLINYTEPSTESSAGQDVNSMGSIDIPNSWFYVLRLIAPIQIPFKFLHSTRLSVEKSKITALLPILQEYILYSQKYMNNSMLNMLVQNRECPSVLDADIEYLLHKIFPGINKLKCYELLDSDTESRQMKPFECLFGSMGAQSQINLSNSLKQEIDNKLYDDNTYGFYSPMNILQQDANQTVQCAVDDCSEDFQKLDISDSIAQDNLFRINPTVLKLKRLNENIIVNTLGLKYWKMLNLEPPLKKNFNILFVIPKANDQFSKITANFINNIIECYSVCKFGKITRATKSGILEIENDSDTTETYWEKAQNKLISAVSELQEGINLEDPTNLLLMFVEPFQNLNSLIKMTETTQQFESILVEKTLSETDTSKRKKKRKNKAIARLPVTVFYKAFAIDSFYMNTDGQFVIFTEEKYVDLSMELFNNCPDNDMNKRMLKDRTNIINIEKDIQEKVNFTLSKKPNSGLVDRETFLHLCYERSVDKKWCVASWIDQSGAFSFTKSWYIDENVEGSENFETVSDDIMSITMDYVANIKGKVYVIMSRLNNIIPDDELAEWKRLSMKNNDIILIVVTAELESSTLILSNNPGPSFGLKRKDDTSKDLTYTVASTNSQSQTPANILLNPNTYPHHVVNSSKFESPDVSMYTPLYDSLLSPIDVNNQQVQVPVQTLEPLPEEIKSQESELQNSILVDISDECYGLILQVPQPLSNQPRIPLKTGFLVNTGEGAIKNKILEINLLSCQAGISTNRFLKKLLVQYRKLSSFVQYLGMPGISRKCGNVEFEEAGDDDDDEEFLWEDKNNNALNINTSGTSIFSDKKREKQFIHQQYMQFYRLQQKQKRQKVRERERELLETDTGYNVVPVHMLCVRKMLDVLVNIDVK